MKERILQIINYKTGGNKADFAALQGWSPQYLNNLLGGKSLGLTPIVTILTTCPEIDARWLILGEGDMIVNDRRNRALDVLCRAILKSDDAGIQSAVETLGQAL